MLLFGAIAFVGFWSYAVRLWALDGARIPLVFIGLWGLGLFGSLSLGLSSHLFMGFQAILALVLIVINGYQVPPLS